MMTKSDRRQAVYEVKPVSELDPAWVARDIGVEPEPGSYAVIRATVRLGPRIWSVHKTEDLANAAARRNKSREIVTR